MAAVIDVMVVEGEMLINIGIPITICLGDIIIVSIAVHISGGIVTNGADHSESSGIAETLVG